METGLALVPTREARNDSAVRRAASGVTTDAWTMPQNDKSNPTRNMVFFILRSFIQVRQCILEKSISIPFWNVETSAQSKYSIRREVTVIV